MQQNTQRTPAKEWHPSDVKKNIVLLELLSAERPLRHDELEEKLAGKVSGVTLSKALDDLEEEGKILRNAKSRKCIEYAPNSKHHIIQEILPVLAETIFYHNRLMMKKKDSTYGWLPAEFALRKIHEASGKTRRKLIRLAIQYYLYDVTYDLLYTICANVIRRMKTSEIKTQLPLVETIFEEKILTFSNVVRQKLVELAKLDKNEFDLTAQKWLNKCKYGSVHEGAQPFVSTFYRGDGALTASMQRTPEMTPEEMKELQHSLIRKWSFT